MRSPTAQPRICVVGSGPRFLSGISYYTHRLSVALGSRYDVGVVLMRRLLPERFYPGRARVGQQLHGFAYPPTTPVYDGVDWYWGRSIVGAVRFLRKTRPEVVVLQWWTGTVLHTYLLLAVVARLSGAKVVLEFHEVQDVGELGVPLAGRYVNGVFPVLLRLTSGAVVHSEFDRTALHERYGLADRPVALIAHGPYAPDQLPAPAAEDDPDRPLELLSFGVIRPFKGVEDLVQAFDLLSDEQASRFHLTVVGETWEGWTLPAELIARSRHRDRISFVNRYVAEAEVAAFFRAADAVVLPYHRSSASGPLHTAMGYGLPVVVTGVGGLVEAAGDYKGAIFVPPREPSALVEAFGRLHAMRGRHYDDPQSWDRTVEGYASLFERLGVRSPAPAPRAGVA